MYDVVVLSDSLLQIFINGNNNTYDYVIYSYMSYSVVSRFQNILP